MDKRARLAERLKQPGLIVAPGVFELISAKIADRMGFDCLYVTGYGLVASHLGLPDAGLATYSDMVGRVAQIGAMTRTPFIADDDTGYGGLLNVQHTVRGYEAAGACAIQAVFSLRFRVCAMRSERAASSANCIAGDYYAPARAIINASVATKTWIGPEAGQWSAG